MTGTLGAPSGGEDGVARLLLRSVAYTGVLYLQIGLVAAARTLLSAADIGIAPARRTAPPATADSALLSVVIYPLIETAIVVLVWRLCARRLRVGPRAVAPGFAALLAALAWLTHGMHAGALHPALAFAFIGHFYAHAREQYPRHAGAASLGAFLIHAPYNVPHALVRAPTLV